MGARRLGDKRCSRFGNLYLTRAGDLILPANVSMFDESEVEDLHYVQLAPVTAQEDVGRFDVTMHDAGEMCLVE